MKQANVPVISNKTNICKFIKILNLHRVSLKRSAQYMLMHVKRSNHFYSDLTLSHESKDNKIENKI